MNTNTSVLLNSRILPSFQEAQKKKFHSLQLGKAQEHLEFRQRLWRISKHSKTRLQFMEHEAAIEDESRWCSELQD